MLTIWRDRPAVLLAALAVIEVLLVVYTRTAGAEYNADQPFGASIFWLMLSLGLTWRVWRGGWVARGVLVGLSALPLLTIATSVSDASWYVSGLVAFGVVQLVLLFSPAVRRNIREHAEPAAA